TNLHSHSIAMVFPHVSFNDTSTTDIYTLSLHDALPIFSGDKFYFHEVIGFEVEDQRLGSVGTIQSINDSSAQPLFEVIKTDIYGSKEILIPMIDQFLVKIDRTNKKVIMDLPEGLIEMYL